MERYHDEMKDKCICRVTTDVKSPQNGGEEEDHNISEMQKKRKKDEETKIGWFSLSWTHFQFLNTHMWLMLSLLHDSMKLLKAVLTSSRDCFYNTLQDLSLSRPALPVCCWTLEIWYQDIESSLHQTFYLFQQLFKSREPRD